MQRVPLSQVRPGMRVGRAIYSADGRVLLNAGVVLRESYIEHLKKLGIPSVYIETDLAPDVQPPEVIKEQTRRQLTKELKTFLTTVSGSFGASAKKTATSFGASDINDLNRAMAEVVSELADNPNALIHLQDIRLADEYTLGHSIEVCVLSVMVGVSLGMDNASLRELGLGAVLHDVGKQRIPPEILNKPGPLTAEEMKIMQTHTTIGFEILTGQRQVSYHSAHVALQHHERWNGGGYPRALKAEQIHPYARIVAIADVYDAMVADRVYRPGYAPERALRVLAEICHDFFDPKVYAAFVVNIAKYPVGTLVTLSDGATAVVLEVKKGMPDSPRVRVVKDAAGNRLANPQEIDLALSRLMIRGIEEDDGSAEVITTA